ncbi:MAG: protein phosphatase 2C domain-containing protein [Caulobacterales bacterium]|nr:protein phosphatase 2C domain-containing protein [Caulobacterales bacterium]
MTLTVLDQINAPGAALGAEAARAGRMGDDRYGFDEAAGTAWVIDGATDVGDIRVFDTGESDAAWYAEALSRRLTIPPATGEDVRAYWRAALGDVREEARREARFAIETLPGASIPCASGVWLRRRGSVADLAWMGDCMAILAGPDGGARLYGAADGVDAERQGARAYHAADADGRRRLLQEGRARATAPGSGHVLSLHPEASDRMRLEEVALPAGAHALVFSDGLYRLIDPFARYDAEGLIGAAVERGLGALVSELRAMEQAPADGHDVARVKKVDDAAAVLARAEQGGLLKVAPPLT